jgi:F-type H+-transporting ATPase subunit epsilon
VAESINHGGDVKLAENILQCVVVTPEETALQTPAQFVALPLFDGEVGIAPAHSPMIGRLGYGEMRITEGDSVRRYYVDGGFVQVSGNVVSVLTSRAVPIEELDEQAARDQLSEAMSKPANTPELIAIRDRMQAQSRAQIRLTTKAK